MAQLAKICVREIARSGIQDFEFFESSAQSKIHWMAKRPVTFMPFELIVRLTFVLMIS